MPRGAKPKCYPPEMVAAVETLYYEKGMTQSEIAQELGTTQKVIWKLMLRHNLQARTAAKRNQNGPMNDMWTGDAAGYQALHLRVARLRGTPQCCEHCGTSDPTTSYDWANMTGDYANPVDYKRLCRSCHHKYDGRVHNLGEWAIPKFQRKGGTHYA